MPSAAKRGKTTASPDARSSEVGTGARAQETRARRLPKFHTPVRAGVLDGPIVCRMFHSIISGSMGPD